MKTVLQNKIPEEELNIFNTEIKEVISTNINTARITVKESNRINEVVHQYSKYHTILNIVAQCFRSIYLMTNNIQDGTRKQLFRRNFELNRISEDISKDMSPEDQKKMYKSPSLQKLNFARNYLIKEAQTITNSDQYQALENNKPISEKSPLIKLNPILKDGIMIMKGRLDNLLTMPEQMKNPIILPKDARITDLIILQHHKDSTHSGPELTLRNVRLQYLKVGGKRQIRKAIRPRGHNLCKHPQPQGQTQQIANLPIPRITPGNFKGISIDFTGPFRAKKCEVCKNQQLCQECSDKIKKNTKTEKSEVHKKHTFVFLHVTVVEQYI